MSIRYVFREVFICIIFILAAVFLFTGCNSLSAGNKKAKEEEKNIFGFLEGYNYRIKEAQEYLSKAGFDPGPVDGKMHKGTREAIKDFQKKNNLKASGFIDSETWTKLSNYKTYAISANTVKEAQRALKAAGFDPGPIDGKVGPKTKNAIIEFQRANGLKPNGQLDDKTLVKLKN